MEGRVIAGNITDTIELRMLDWVNVVGTPTRPTAPLKVRLMTANGSDSAAGTEVSGGSYASQTVTFTTAASGAAANDANIDFTSMPASTIVGLEVWDSAGTPIRLWYGALTASKTLNSGDTFRIATSSLTVALD